MPQTWSLYLFLMGSYTRSCGREETSRWRGESVPFSSRSCLPPSLSKTFFLYAVCHFSCLAGYMGGYNGQIKDGENHGQGCTPVVMHHSASSTQVSGNSTLLRWLLGPPTVRLTFTICCKLFIATFISFSDLFSVFIYLFFVSIFIFFCSFIPAPYNPAAAAPGFFFIIRLITGGIRLLYLWCHGSYRIIPLLIFAGKYSEGRLSGFSFYESCIPAWRLRTSFYGWLKIWFWRPLRPILRIYTLLQPSFVSLLKGAKIAAGDWDPSSHVILVDYVFTHKKKSRHRLKKPVVRGSFTWKDV